MSSKKKVYETPSKVSDVVKIRDYGNSTMKIGSKRSLSEQERRKANS